MGNALHVSLLNYSRSLQFPSRLLLRGSASIELKMYPFGSYDVREVKCTVDGSTRVFKLVLQPDEFDKVKTVAFILGDGKKLSPTGFMLSRTKTGFIQVESDVIFKWTKRNRTVGAKGGFTEMNFYLYEDANLAGLLVFECKKNIWNDGEISEVTLAYYFARGSGSAFMGTESDIGLSIVAKVRASDGNLDVTVEGVEQHPACGLFYMFHEVNRTGVWKRTMCPHCADKRRGRMFWQSDSEDSDGNVVVPSQRNGKNISNEGSFKGNGNGSFIRCRNYYSS